MADDSRRIYGLDILRAYAIFTVVYAHAHEWVASYVGAALYTLRMAKELGQFDRVILGTDGPAGSGVQPLGIVRMVAMLSALGEVPAEVAFCFATGNTARMRSLDCGLIEPGRAADFVFMDKAQHSAGKSFLDSITLGDLPGIGMVVIDGVVRSGRSRNTPPAEKIPAVVT